MASSIKHTEKHITEELLIKNKYVMAAYKRFQNEVIKNITEQDTGHILEIGSMHISLVKGIFPNVVTSDIAPSKEIDICCSAESLPFDDSSISVLVMCNVLHHIKKPRKFFKEAERTLIPGGKIIMIEPSMTFFGKWIRKFFHHETLNMKTSWEIPGNHPMDSNLANPWIIFKRDKTIFHEEFPKLKLISYVSHTPLLYALGGGANYRSILPDFLLGFIILIEKLISPFNKIFGMSATIVVSRKKDVIKY